MKGNKMKIKIHSLSNAVTNSSTTVYCYASNSGMQFIKDIVNQVLKDGGSNKTFDDLYDIKVEYDDNVYECIADDHYNEWPDVDWPGKIERAKQWLKDNPDDAPTNWCDYDYPTHYEITVKNKGDEKLMNKINSLFSYEGFRDG
jgi:hypothetical protein